MANAKVYGTNAWVEGFGQKIVINIEAMNHKEAEEIASVIPGLIVYHKAMSIHKGGRWSSKENEIRQLKDIFKECEVFMEDF